jgi:hypothetical protein
MNARVAHLAAAPMFLAALASCRTAAPKPNPPAPTKPVAQAAAPAAARTPKEDCEELMNFVMPFAQKMLKKQRSFIPFAATMAPDGRIDGSMALTKDSSDVNELISMLELGLRQGASEGKYKATALVVDMVIVPPGKTAKQDGVAVRLDHRDGYSVIVGFPYSFSNTGELVVEAPFAQEGAHQVFPPGAGPSTAGGGRAPTGKRIPVARGWTVMVPADFQVIDNGDSLQALKGGRIVYLSAPALPAGATANRAHAVCDQMSSLFVGLPPQDLLTHAAGKLEGRAGFFHEGDVWRLKGVMCADGAVAIAVADLPEAKDRDWAISVWRSFEHP